MQEIPKIIHQVWSETEEPLPDYLSALGDTWKRDYPDWKYILWNQEQMDHFVKENYPGFLQIYKNFPYNVQRWDAVRYLILDKMGGMYVDFDYESLNPIEDIVKGKTCCFSSEPKSHGRIFGSEELQLFSNALIMSIPGHPFLKQIIQTVFSGQTLNHDLPKEICVLNTTGPWMLARLYHNLDIQEKESVYLIPAKFVTPFDLFQADRFKRGEMSQELEDCLEEAYAVHYFLGDWRNNDT